MPYTPVRRTRWDARQREMAALIDSREPGWVVVYGPWSRRFTAFAAWPAPWGVVVDASTPEGLREAMRAAEAKHGVPLAPACGARPAAPCAS